MNKWLRMAVHSFIGILVLNLLFGFLFGGGVYLSAAPLAALLAFGVKLLYIALVAGLIAGVLVAVRDFVLQKD